MGGVGEGSWGNGSGVAGGGGVGGLCWAADKYAQEPVTDAFFDGVII